MENSELEERIDEFAEIRADILLIKAQLEGQQKTYIPRSLKITYAIFVILMLVYIVISFRNGQIISNIDRNFTSLIESNELIPE